MRCAPSRRGSTHQLGHQDGGRLVQQLYGHPEEERSRDLVRMAFAADGCADLTHAIEDGGQNAP